MTVSTGLADPTRSKRPYRLAFCTSQQREAFSVESTGSQSIHNTLQPMLDQLRNLSEEHRGDPKHFVSAAGARSAASGDTRRCLRASLPEDRQKLFGLLQTMERSGGWPTSRGCSCAHLLICLIKAPPIWPPRPPVSEGDSAAGGKRELVLCARLDLIGGSQQPAAVFQTRVPGQDDRWDYHQQITPFREQLLATKGEQLLFEPAKAAKPSKS